jgi:transposase
VWTSERIALLIWRSFRVRYSQDHVHHLLHGLGWRWHEHTWLPSTQLPRISNRAPKLTVALSNRIPPEKRAYR